jgi:hypothetical protein
MRKVVEVFEIVWDQCGMKAVMVMGNEVGGKQLNNCVEGS